MDKYVTVTFDVDADAYDQAAAYFKSIGVTVEDMAVAFLRFFAIPENQPLLKIYLNEDSDMELKDKVFEQIYNIAIKAIVYNSSVGR